MESQHVHSGFIVSAILAGLVAGQGAATLATPDDATPDRTGASPGQVVKRPRTRGGTERPQRPAARVISANQFRLVDSEGTRRGMLGSRGETTFLYLMDGNGKTRVRLHVSSGARLPTMEFLDERGRSRSTTAVNARPRRPSPKIALLRRIAAQNRPNRGVDDPKADAAGYADVKILQQQIDQIRERLNEVITNVNRR